MHITNISEFSKTTMVEQQSSILKWQNQTLLRNALNDILMQSDVLCIVVHLISNFTATGLSLRTALSVQS